MAERLSGVVAQIAGGQVGPGLRGAAGGYLDDGLEGRWGRGAGVVDYQAVIPGGFLQFSPAMCQAPGRTPGIRSAGSA